MQFVLMQSGINWSTGCIACVFKGTYNLELLLLLLLLNCRRSFTGTRMLVNQSKEGAVGISLQNKVSLMSRLVPSYPLLIMLLK